MDLFEHFKEVYHTENERTKDLSDALTIPMGIISVLATILTYYVTNFDYAYNIWLTVVFLVTVVFGVYFLGLAIANLWKAYDITGTSHNTAYLYLPYLEEQNNYYEGILEYYSADEYKDEDIKSLAIKDFENYLQKTYIENATNNARLNFKCTEYIFNCKRKMLYFIILLAIMLVPFGINYELKPEHPTLIEIKKGVTSQSKDNKKNTDMALPKNNNDSGKTAGSHDKPASNTPSTNSQGISYPRAPESLRVKDGKIVGDSNKKR